MEKFEDVGTELNVDEDHGDKGTKRESRGKESDILQRRKGVGGGREGGREVGEIGFFIKTASFNINYNRQIAPNSLFNLHNFAL